MDFMLEHDPERGREFVQRFKDEVDTKKVWMMWDREAYYDFLRSAPPAGSQRAKTGADPRPDLVGTARTARSLERLDPHRPARQRPLGHDQADAACQQRIVVVDDVGDAARPSISPMMRFPCTVSDSRYGRSSSTGNGVFGEDGYGLRGPSPAAPCRRRTAAARTSDACRRRGRRCPPCLARRIVTSAVTR